MSWHTSDVTCSSDHISSLSIPIGPEWKRHQVQGSGSKLQQVPLVPNISSLPFRWQLWIKYSLFTQVLSAVWCAALLLIGRQSSERAQALRFLIAHVQPWWIASCGGKSFNQRSSDMLERGGFWKEGRDKSFIEQTNKCAHFCPQCGLQASGSQGCSTWMSTRWLPFEVWENVMGRLPYMCRHTQFSLCDCVIKSRLQRHKPTLRCMWLTYTKEYILPLSLSVHHFPLWLTHSRGALAC